MITQIEIDGFKTFKDFKVELAPFQVIVGANGSGKSNLFDAIQLLGRLAEKDLISTFLVSQNEPGGVRGNLYELFTRFPNGQRAHSMRFAVEMLLDRSVKDKWGNEATLEYRRLRYELEITLQKRSKGPDHLYVTHESLVSLDAKGDEWIKKQKGSDLESGLAASPTEPQVFIASSKEIESGEETVIQLLSEQGKQVKKSFSRRMRSTLLSGVITCDFPHVFAVHEELRSCRFFFFQPDALRQPSLFSDPENLDPNGKNLPATLARMQTEDEFAVNFVSLDMVNLTPDLGWIELVEDVQERKYTILVKNQDGNVFPAHLLSDGALHLLALAVLKNDLQLRGILCIEEPENNVNPIYLTRLAPLLRKLATDLSNPEEFDEPLRQVFITTHSPILVSQPAIRNSLLFASTVTLIVSLPNGVESLHVTSLEPVVSLEEMRTFKEKKQISGAAYTLDHVLRYLSGDALESARDALEKTRNVPYER